MTAREVSQQIWSQWSLTFEVRKRWVSARTVDARDLVAMEPDL